MSADNWTTCPRCARRAQEEHLELVQKVADSYGTLPSADWLALKAKADEEVTIDLSFREDYEFYGASEGYVAWVYKGRCSNCGLIHELDGSQPILGVDE